MSVTDPLIHVALAAVMADVREVGKTDKNTFHKFMFRGVDTVLNEVGPVLRKHRVIVLPELVDLVSRDVPTKNGTAREVTVTVAYTFHGPAGDALTATVPGEAQDSGDKAVSKAMSVAFRTALIQALSIPTHEKDPDASTYERSADPLVEMKRKVWVEAEKRGWDMAALDREYGAFTNDGGAIGDADLAGLTAFHRHLVPLRTVQRAKAPAVKASRAAAPVPVEPPFDDMPPPEAPAQRPGNAKGAMFAALGKLELPDREAELRYVSGVLGKPVTSRRELTEDQMREVASEARAEALSRQADEVTA